MIQTYCIKCTASFPKFLRYESKRSSKRESKTVSSRLYFFNRLQVSQFLSTTWPYSRDCWCGQRWDSWSDNRPASWRHSFCRGECRYRLLNVGDGKIQDGEGGWSMVLLGIHQDLRSPGDEVRSEPTPDGEIARQPDLPNTDQQSPVQSRTQVMSTPPLFGYTLLIRSRRALPILHPGLRMGACLHLQIASKLYSHEMANQHEKSYCIRVRVIGRGRGKPHVDLSIRERRTGEV